LLFGMAFGGVIARPKLSALFALAMAAMGAVAVTSVFWNPLSSEWYIVQAEKAIQRHDDRAELAAYQGYLDHGGIDKVWALRNMAAEYDKLEDQKSLIDTLRKLAATDPQYQKLLDDVLKETGAH
jgi:hypothetical protein